MTAVIRGIVPVTGVAVRGVMPVRRAAMGRVVSVTRVVAMTPIRDPHFVRAPGARDQGDDAVREKSQKWEEDDESGQERLEHTGGLDLEQGRGEELERDHPVTT